MVSGYMASQDRVGRALISMSVHSYKVCTIISAIDIGTLFDLDQRVKSNPNLARPALHRATRRIGRERRARGRAQCGRGLIDIDIRDVDVPLSELGKRQAIALGRWFAALPDDQRPNVVLTSPYLRARHTAGMIIKTAGMAEDAYSLIVDERLREKEFGILDRLTPVGIERAYPRTG